MEMQYSYSLEETGFAKADAELALANWIEIGIHSLLDLQTHLSVWGVLSSE